MISLDDKWLQYLKECWNNEFHHSYIDNQTRNSWSCFSLKNAYENYFWNGKDVYITKDLLDSYSYDMQQSLKFEDDIRTYDISMKILRWGGVAGNVRGGIPRPTVAWLNRQLEGKSLTKNLIAGLNALRVGNFDEFDGHKLPMDSAATKIFSLVDTNNYIIIYDGRVGAALGLLARSFLKNNNIDYVPEQFSFMWGKSRSPNLNRDPSINNYYFHQLWYGNDRNQRHAKMVIETSKLISLLSSQTGTTSRQWEAALFMVGYDLGKKE